MGEPYVFVSYAHKDAASVVPLIEGLRSRGIRVWYDAHLEGGSDWTRVISRQLVDCSCVLCFITANFLQSENCMDEIHFAKEEKKGPVIVYLEEVSPTPEMRVFFSRIHALYRSRFSSTGAMLDALQGNSILAACRAGAGPRKAPPVQQQNQGNTPQTREILRRGLQYYADRKFTEAVMCFQKAAKSGNADAQYQLGVCYYNGEGVSQDYDKAVDLFISAVEQEHTDAMVFLGVCCHLGRGLKQCDNTAFRLFMAAAKRDNAVANYNLAVFLEQGTAVTQNYADAARLYRRALELGYKEAREGMERCEKAAGNSR